MHDSTLLICSVLICFSAVSCVRGSLGGQTGTVQNHTCACVRTNILKICMRTPTCVFLFRCETLVEDIWTRSLQTSWVQSLAASKSNGNSAATALHISGASVAKACATKPLPAFAKSYSVHPCTAAAANDGRCAARQQYYLRNNSGTDEDHV
jgi:hypothetical protein